jgi:hypothetical protein
MAADVPQEAMQMQNIRLAFEDLGTRVNQALRTQIGDAARLNAHRDECLRLSIHIHAVSYRTKVWVVQ